MKPVWFDMEEILVGKANARLVKRNNTPWGQNPMTFRRAFLEYDEAIWSLVKAPRGSGPRGSRRTG